VTDVRPGASLQVIGVDAAHITVRVTSPPIGVTLLQLAGVGKRVQVTAAGEAEPQSGITQPGQ
jgi:hypothetical protein